MLSATARLVFADEPLGAPSPARSTAAGTAVDGTPPRRGSSTSAGSSAPRGRQASTSAVPRRTSTCRPDRRRRVGRTGSGQDAVVIFAFLSARLRRGSCLPCCSRWPAGRSRPGVRVGGRNPLRRLGPAHHRWLPASPSYRPGGPPSAGASACRRRTTRGGRPAGAGSGGDRSSRCPRPRCTPSARPVFTQSWRDLTMLHWPVPAEAVAPLLPAGTTDAHDGTHAGPRPVRHARHRRARTPPLPWVSSVRRDQRAA